jgi:rubredoxin
MILTCPVCHARHYDDGEFAITPHHTHACQSCGFVWRPAIEPTVGVDFLPGFKNDDTEVREGATAWTLAEVARLRDLNKRAFALGVRFADNRCSPEDLQAARKELERPEVKAYLQQLGVAVPEPRPQLETLWSWKRGGFVLELYQDGSLGVSAGDGEYSTVFPAESIPGLLNVNGVFTPKDPT